MKIFIVKGSNCSIEAVFSTKEKAVAYCALHGCYDVEEYTVDVEQVDESVEVFRNYIFISFLGKIELIDVRFTTKNRVKLQKKCHNFEIEVSLKEENETQAYKIARSLYEYYKFEPENLDLEFKIEE